MNMEWIKVTDRLPAEDDYDQYGEIALWYNGKSYTPGLNVSHKDSRIKEYVTHWARIEPPKE